MTSILVTVFVLFIIMPEAITDWACDELWIPIEI